MKTKALSREERKHQITLVFLIDLQKNLPAELTVAMIARRLDVTASSKLRAILGELVQDGTLEMHEEPIPGVAGIRRIYTPNYARFGYSPRIGQKARSIRINGKQGTIWGEMNDEN